LVESGADTHVKSLEAEVKTSEADARDIKARVHRYYHAATEDYLKYYQSGWHHHMHYGFDRDLPRGGNPTEHMVRYLAGLAGIGKTDRILDAGCGVGGSGIFLARDLGCRCVGITLVESQAKLAKGFAEASARKHPGTPEARFSVNDFHAPAFKPGSFDVVWAVESFDHAVDKAAWVAAMFAILKPGGRLVIADGFRAGAPANASQAREYRGFLAGWAVPHLCTPAEMESYGARAGFQRVHGEDISADVMPHARAIFRFGLIFIPLRWLLAKLRLTSPEKLGNAYATYFQYRTLKQGLWSYRAFCFRKPA
jgi:SAM-dependent methyltransferase